jgi:hypothetical protein
MRVDQGGQIDEGTPAEAPATASVARVSPVALAVSVVVALLAGALVGAFVTGGDDPPAPDAEVLAATTSALPAGTEPAGTESAEPATSDGHSHGELDRADEERPSIVEFGGDERAALAAQLLTVREVALLHPTYADALAAGYVPTTPYAPGTGAHVGKAADAQQNGTPLDLQRPQSYLYDGTEPDSRLVGVMYVQLGGDQAPDGFVGPLDRWSRTRGQCLKKDSMDPAYPAAPSVTEEMCDAVAGTFIDLIAWTQHAWVVPGWEAPGGVFAPLNDDIVCADGTTDSDPVEGCEAPTSTGGAR